MSNILISTPSKQNSFREPMLAVDFDESKIYQILQNQGFGYVQPKIDGMRVTIIDKKPMTRSMKVHPNIGLQCLSNVLTGNWDGEVVQGYPRYDGFRETTSLRKHNKLTDFTFWIFDKPDRKTSFEQWYTNTTIPAFNTKIEWNGQACTAYVRKVPTYMVHDLDDIYRYEKIFAKQNAEGLIFRARHSDYTPSRSSLQKSQLVRLKRWADAEGKIVGFTPFFRNYNPVNINEVGRSVRSSAKDGKVQENKLGALVIKLDNGEQFHLGVGFTEAERVSMWHERETLLGRYAKFKYFDIGSYNKPRMPSFIGIREAWDLSK